MRTGLLFVAILLSLPAAQADIYKCKDAHGQTVFSQLPCAPDAQKITVDTTQPTQAQAEATQEANAQNRKLSTDGDEARRMQGARNRVQQLVSERDNEIAALRHKKSYAANNLAGATWEKSISDEMQAVAERYNADISAARDRVRALEQQAADKKDNKSTQ